MNRFRKYKDEWAEAFLRETLKNHDWKIAPAAKYLGMERAALYRLMKRYFIERPVTDASRDSGNAGVRQNGPVSPLRTEGEEIPKETP